MQARLAQLFAESDALRAEAALLVARSKMPLSVAERAQNTALIVANTQRIQANTSAIYAAKGIAPPQSATPLPSAKKPTSFMGWVVVVIGALVIIGWISSAFNHTSSSATDTPVAVNQAAYSPQTANRYSTNSSGQQTWSGIPISQLTGSEWMQMNAIEKAALVGVYLSGVPYCTESVSQGVNALDTIFGPVPNRTSDITGTFAGWIVADGCHKP